MNWQKLSLTDPEHQKLLWLRPERKPQQARVAVIGGSSTNFNRMQELFKLLANLELQSLTIFLPASLKKFLPEVSGIEFIGTNNTLSFTEQEWEVLSLKMSEYSVGFVTNDISNNSSTILGAQKFLNSCKTPILLDAGLTAILESDCEAHSVFLEQRDIQVLTKKLKLPKTITSNSSLDDIKQCLELVQNKISSCTIYADNKFTFICSQGGSIWFKGFVHPHHLLSVIGENFLPPTKSFIVAALLSDQA